MAVMMAGGYGSDHSNTIALTQTQRGERVLPAGDPKV